jgi:hypothetical protein
MSPAQKRRVIAAMNSVLGSDTRGELADFSLSHAALQIRLFPDAESHLAGKDCVILRCEGCLRIDAPVRWRGGFLSLVDVPIGDRLHYQVVDVVAGVRITCGVVRLGPEPSPASPRREKRGRQP